MRTVLFSFFFLLSCLSLSAQYMDEISKNDLKNPTYGYGALPHDEDGNLEFKEVFPMEGLTRDEIYIRAIHSLGEMAKNTVYRITAQDDANYFIKGEAHYEFIYWHSVTFGNASAYRLKFDISVECRDGRYRLVLDNFKEFTLIQVNTVSPEGYKVPHFEEPAVGYGVLGDADGREVVDKKGRVSIYRAGLIKCIRNIPKQFSDYMSQPVPVKEGTKPKLDEEW